MSGSPGNSSAPAVRQVRASSYRPSSASAPAVSFARTGGCIAVLTREEGKSIKKFVTPDDLIAPAQKTRTKLLAAAVNKPFHSLDRRFRQELLAMDGATVLTHKGNG